MENTGADDEASLGEHRASARSDLARENVTTGSSRNRSRAASLCASLIWTATVRRIFMSTGENIRRFTAIRWRTMTTGGGSCRGGSCRRRIFGENFTFECTRRDGLARKTQFIWAIGFLLARRK